MNNTNFDEFSNIPSSTPENIKFAFTQGIKCMTIGCWDAATVMFRKCLDLMTKPMLPSGSDNFLYENLAARLNFLFTNGLLPNNLREPAEHIRENGDVAAHDGMLSEGAALDTLHPTYTLLEYVYSK